MIFRHHPIPLYRQRTLITYVPYFRHTDQHLITKLQFKWNTIMEEIHLSLTMLINLQLWEQIFRAFLVTWLIEVDIKIRKNKIYYQMLYLMRNVIVPRMINISKEQYFLIIMYTHTHTPLRRAIGNSIEINGKDWHAQIHKLFVLLLYIILISNTNKN